MTNPLHKIPLVLKYIFAYLFFVLLYGFLSYAIFMQDSIQAFVNGLSTSESAVFLTYAKTLFWGGLFAGFACLVTLLIREKVFVKRVNGILTHGLTERKLDQLMDQFTLNKQLSELDVAIEGYLNLTRSMDQLKASKINLDQQTLKLILNNVHEGIMMVSKDRVVTHVNREAEDLLRLIPGEIVGQSVSRKISQEVFLDELDKAIDHDHKISDAKFNIQDDAPLLLNIFPVKNKFGEVVQALIILEKDLKKSKK